MAINTNNTIDAYNSGFMSPYFNTGTKQSIQPTQNPIFDVFQQPTNNTPVNSSTYGLPKETTQPKGFDLDNTGKIIEGSANALSALTNLGVGIANIIFADKDRKRAEEQFKFEKQAYSKNLSNQATLINNKIDSSAHYAAIQAGLVNNSGNPEQQAAYDDFIQKNAKDRHVSGSL